MSKTRVSSTGALQTKRGLVVALFGAMKGAGQYLRGVVTVGSKTNPGLPRKASFGFRSRRLNLASAQSVGRGAREATGSLQSGTAQSAGLQLSAGLSPRTRGAGAEVEVGQGATAGSEESRGGRRGGGKRRSAPADPRRQGYGGVRYGERRSRREPCCVSAGES